MYHRVSKEPVDPWDLCVSPDRFAEQMAALGETGACGKLDECVGSVRFSHSGSPRIAITFDDGYADNVISALPILERYDVPATIFIVSGILGCSREFWWDTLARCILAPQIFSPRLALDLGQGDEVFALEDGSNPASSRADGQWRADHEEPSTPRQRVFLALWNRLVVMSASARQPILDRLVSQAGVDAKPPPERLPLTAEDVARLSVHPLIEVGAHTVSHASLTDLAPAEQHAEIVGSKLAIEKITNKPVRLFSYPYGRHDASTVDIVRRAGFMLACTSKPVAATAFSRRHRLPRLQISDDDGETFLRKVRQAAGFSTRLQ